LALGLGLLRRCLLRRGAVGGRYDIGGGRAGQGHDTAGLIQTILFEEAVQGHARDVHAPAAADEVEQIPAGCLGLLAEELCNRAGKARQEFAMAAAGQAMVGGLDDLLGGQPLLGAGGGATEAEQAGDLGHLQAGLGVEQNVAEQAAGEVVVAAMLEDMKGGLQDSALGFGQGIFGNGAVLEPTGQGQRFGRHGGLSVAEGNRDSLWRRS
jgi:hypothetical protein